MVIGFLTFFLLGIVGLIIFLIFLVGWIFKPLNEPTKEFLEETLIEISTPSIKPKVFEFRPQTWEQFIGQENSKEKAQTIIAKAKKDIRSHFIIDGLPGCFVKGTKILMHDYTWKSIEEVKVGDRVIGFDENGQRNLKSATVINTMERKSTSLVRVTNSKNQIYTTEEHPFLIYTKKHTNQWREASTIKDDKHASYYFPSYKRTHSWETGWLLGSIESDGSLPANYRTVLYYNKNKKLINEFCRIIKRFHPNPHVLQKANGTFQVTTNANFTRQKIETLAKKFRRLQVSSDFLRGYIAGYYDGDGGKDGISSTDLVHLQFIQKILKDNFGFDCPINQKKVDNHWIDEKYKSKKDYFRLNLNQLTIFYCTFQPFSKYCYGQLNVTPKQKIIKIEHINKQSVVYNLTTSTNTYIANGFPVHNCGKTTFAHLVAKDLNAEIIEYIGKQIDENMIPQIVNQINSCEKEHLILFIDEIDTMDWKVFKIFNPLIEQFKFEGQDIRMFTFACATINKHLLIENNPDTLQRIPPTHQLKFERYNIEEIGKIVRQYREQLYPMYNVKEEILHKIAQNSKFNPRTAIALLEDYLINYDIDKVFKNCKIVKDGLTNIDVIILETLNESRKKDGDPKPLGANTLALKSKLSPKEYLIEFEPFLLEYDYINKVPSRVITKKGEEFLESIKLIGKINE